MIPLPVLQILLSMLLEENLFPVIIGGSSALVPAIDRALSQSENKIYP